MSPMGGSAHCAANLKEYPFPGGGDDYSAEGLYRWLAMALVEGVGKPSGPPKYTRHSTLASSANRAKSG